MKKFRDFLKVPQLAKVKPGQQTQGIWFLNPTLPPRVTLPRQVIATQFRTAAIT